LPANPSPTGVGEHATGQHRRPEKICIIGPHRRLEKICITGQLSFSQKLFSFPKPSIIGRKKKPEKNPLFFFPNTRFFFLCSSSKKKKRKDQRKNKKKQNRKKKSTKPGKTKPKLQILSSKIKSKQQIDSNASKIDSNASTIDSNASKLTLDSKLKPRRKG
jgi:hypothetical protein